MGNNVYDATVDGINTSLKTLKITYKDGATVTVGLVYYQSLGLKLGDSIKVTTDDPNVGGTVFDIQKA